MKHQLLVILTLLALTACGDATKITPTTYSALDGWNEDAHAAAYKLFADSCAVNENKTRAWQSKSEGPVGVRQNWDRVCGIAAQNPEPSNEAARAFFEANFTPYKVETESKPKGTHTGYYEPVLKGARKKHAPYLTPVYGMPEEAYRHFTRAEIEGGALAGHAPVLLYVEDPVMLFFLHIQGSGKVRLPDGSLIGLQYAGQNGHAFVPVGRVMKERGILTEVSMQGIRDWLRANPDQAPELMNTNPSYVYFKLSPGDEMAKGALGLPLTPLRSIAVDDDRAAYGVPTYLDTYVTDYETHGQVPLKRLFVSQDTGGALHGPHRADIFFGRGEVEEWQAGHQNAHGNTYWLLPVDAGVQLRDGTPLTDDELLQLEEQKMLQQKAMPQPLSPPAEPAATLPPSEPQPDGSIGGDDPANAGDPNATTP